ncbi:MAG: MFS transporter [Thermoleophilaceae bacterium]
MFRFDDTSDAPAHRPHYNITFAVLAMAGVSFALLQSLVAPALPAIQHDLHTTATSVAWVLTAYLLSASVATPILGRLGDMFGKERMLVIALAALGAGSVLAALATSVDVLIAARVVQGLGGAIFPLAFGIIRDEFPLDRTPGAIALISALLGVGGGAGIVLAGPIVDHLGYHWLFWFPLIPVTVALAAALLFVPESPVKTPGRVNITGAALLSAWLVCLLLATSQGVTWGWTDPRVLGLYAAGVVLLVAWVRNELGASEPLVDMQMMRLRGVWTVNAAAFLIGAAMFCSFILIPQFVETPASSGFGFGDNVTQAGLVLLPSTLMMLVFGPVSARLTRHYGGKLPLALGAAAAMFSFVFLAAAHSRPLDFYLASAVLGVGIGLAFAAMANLIVEAVPSSQTGVATGMNTVTRSLGGAVGGQVAGSVIASSVPASGLPTEHGFTIAFVLAATAAALGVVCALAVPGRAAARSETVACPQEA